METQTNEKQFEQSKILIVDDHPLICEALSRAINIESDMVVVAVTEDVESAYNAVKEHAPDLVIVDLSLPDHSGLELIERLKSEYPQLPALVLSIHDEITHAARAIRMGAKGYIMKKEKIETILTAVRHVLGGKIWASEKIMPQVLDSCFGRESDPFGVRQRLSKRELEVFELIARGVSTRDIAEKLFISKRTVNSHRDHIKNKLKIQDIVKLHQVAFQWAHDELPNLQQSSGKGG
jgi:DNA-binding NarL/FixJ family response regulator